MNRVFEVSCKFYVKADNMDKVIEYLRETAGIDFFEKHLMLRGVSNKHEIDEDLTEKEA